LFYSRQEFKINLYFPLLNPENYGRPKNFTMETVHLVIKGNVQGVYYRASAKEKANELGVKGWIKNSPGGQVEAMACGNKEQLEKFIEWCRGGPKYAEVSDIIVTTRGEENFNDFSIKK